jgi:hypothetical protein
MATSGEQGNRAMWDIYQGTDVARLPRMRNILARLEILLVVFGRKAFQRFGQCGASVR